MRVYNGGLLVVAAMSPLLGCGDDGGGVETTTPQPTTVPTTLQPDTDVTSTTSPTGVDTTGDAETGGTDSRGEASMTSTPTSDPTTGEPAACIESDCPAMGEFCNGVTGQCEPGCNDDADCSGGTVCDTTLNQCIGCLSDADCDLGSLCSGGTCVPGCSDMQPCQDGLACCTAACVDLLTDPAHCGGCDPCPVLANAESSCEVGVCGLGACTAGFADCDGDPNNGCETDGACECVPNAQIPCYTGPPNSENVGVCHGGMQTCNAQGTGYGACEGEVTPGPVDICSNAIDDDCNNVVDDDADADGDGTTRCNGDCCDEVGPVCLNPNLVNPGAFEVPNNMVDDDCDGAIDNQLPSCDAGLPSNSGNALEYARAIDLCQTAAENDKKWGVISGAFNRANGQNNPDAQARSIRPGFGNAITPQQNASLAVLSTGNAADQNDQSPPYADFQIGKDNAANSGAPPDWLAANGGQFPNAPGCPGAGSSQANNSIQLKLRVRVPTNALSFNVQMYFFSSEWPEWTCTEYNDLFVTLVDSTGMGNPADKNIAIYTTPQNQKYPVGVNLVKAANGLFTQCKNGQFGCQGFDGGNYNGCTGTGQLAGTGFDIVEGGCGNNNTTGGGTGWLKMAGNVKPGEVMEIRFVIWDTADGIYDSLVLLDDWQWSLQASEPGISPN